MLRSPFVTKPASSVLVNVNVTIELMWMIVDSNWSVEVTTHRYELFPKRKHFSLPSGFNVSVEDCGENDSRCINLSITFNQYNLETVEYVICKISKEDKAVHSRVNFTTIQTATERAGDIPSVTNMATDNSSTPVIMKQPTNFGCILCVRTFSVILCLFVSSLMDR